MAARTTAIATFAILFIFGVGCSWRGAVAGCSPWGGCVDNGSSCGVVLKLSNRFFGALAGARFFFGFRPRLLGIGKHWIGTDHADRGLTYSASRQMRSTPLEGNGRVRLYFLSNTANIGPSDKRLPWRLSDGAYRLGALPPS